MEPPSCKHTRWPVGLLMLVAMVLMQMMVLVMIDHMKLIKIFEISYLGLVILWQFYCISIFLGSSFNLIFRGNFLCHKILGQIFISIFWGRFFYSIFWGNFFGSQYSGATFCVIRYWGNFLSQFSGADFLIQYFGATSLGLNILGQLFANILTAD